jgi:hypothetical protein
VPPSARRKPGFEAKTIHRTLEVDPRAGGFKRNMENPLHCDLLVGQTMTNPSAGFCSVEEVRGWWRATR